METLGYSSQAIQSVRDSLLLGEENFKVFDYKIAENRLNVFDADMKVGKHSLFYNGFQGTQIPTFKNYAAEGVDTEVLIAKILNPPKGTGISNEQTHEYLQDITDQMTALRQLDHRLFHEIGGVLRPMLLGIDANTNKKFMSADRQLHRRNWFGSRDHVTLEDAAYLLMGRSVKVTTKPDPNLPENSQRNRRNLPQTSVASEPKPVEPFYWREIDFSKYKNSEGVTEQPPRYVLAKYDSNWGYDARSKFSDFRFPDLATAGELDKAVDLIERGKRYIAVTENPDHPTVVVLAHASRKTMYLLSNDDVNISLHHESFRTAEAQIAHDARREKFLSRFTAEGDNQQVGTDEVLHRPGQTTTAPKQSGEPPADDAALSAPASAAGLQSPISDKSADDRTVQGQMPAQGQPPAPDPGINSSAPNPEEVNKVINPQNKTSTATGKGRHQNLNRAIQPGRTIKEDPENKNRVKQG